MKKKVFFIVFFLSWIFSIPTQAHQLSTAYLTGTLDDTGVFSGQWQVRLYDLERAIGIDSNHNGELQWREVQEHNQAINDYLISHISIDRNHQNCRLTLDKNWQVDSHFNESYLVMQVRAQCALRGAMAIHYSAFFNEDNQHKLLFSLQASPSTTGSQPETHQQSPMILSIDEPSIQFDANQGNRWQTITAFIQQGAIHIWIGFDHILFLCSLLLTCVFVRQHHDWQVNTNLREMTFRAISIVTAFTLAHSITLTATALHWISLPSRWVEVGIAMTVALTALNNIFPLVTRIGWLTFCFGLLHGMGFAGALGELGLPPDQQVITVLAFNLGVELGQLVIVLLVLPLLLISRHWIRYSSYSLTGLSAVILVISMQWVFQRLQ